MLLSITLVAIMVAVCAMVYALTARGAEKHWARIDQLRIDMAYERIAEVERQMTNMVQYANPADYE